MIDGPPSPDPAPPGGGPPKRAPGSRRLTLSPIGFDIVLAATQSAGGLRLAELAHVIGSPISSTQTALRVLVANGLIERVGDDPPRYRLSADHPARAELASLATVLPEPERALGIIVRANPAVSFAAVDDAGFVLALDEQADDAAATLDHHLGLVAGARAEAPAVIRMSVDEFRRMLRVSLDLRARVRRALVLRGGGRFSAPVDAGSKDCRAG